MKKLLFSIVFTICTTITFFSQKTGTLEPFTPEDNIVTQRKALESEIKATITLIKQKRNNVLMLSLQGNPKNSNEDLTEEEKQILANNQQFISEVNTLLPILISKSVNYFKIYWSFTDNELIEIFGSNYSNNETLAFSSLGYIELVNNYPQYLNPVDFPNLGLPNEESSISNPINSNNEILENIEQYSILGSPTVGGCIGEAVGINLIKDAIQGGLKNLGKKAAIKAFTKIASKTVGFIGAAIMAIEFSECMGWTDLY